jgi:nitrite reductase (NADH) large subunit
MDGGLDYLYDVIVNDSLGIAEELETTMQGLIDNYHCEWKKVVEDPSLRARFKHFVNSEEADPTLEFVDMRGQKCPTDWNKPSLI